jgi:ABC-type transport system substrate-binding protein
LDQNVVRTRVVTGEFEAAVFRFWNSLEGHIQWFGRRGETQYDSRHFPDIGYRKAEVASFLSAARETVDAGERDRVYRELAPIILADVPITFLYPETQAYVVHRRVRGLESPYRADPIRFVERLWIER